MAYRVLVNHAYQAIVYELSFATRAVDLPVGDSQ
jgi:hypothetical protein